MRRLNTGEEGTMKRKSAISALVAAMGMVALALSAAACEFSFSFAAIEAPLGTVGEIGVRVQKEHNNCTLPSMGDYQFDWENIQLLGETAWEEIGSNLYEKWFQVSLSQIGDGYLRISKDCTKEGYEEAVLAISVLEPTRDGIWQQAYEGTYPLADPETAALASIAGDGVVVEGTLSIDELAIDLPVIPFGFDGELAWVRAFYMKTSDDEIVPLLVATEAFFLRFDHLVGDES